jgi:CheY-like chemotaxis protein
VSELAQLLRRTMGERIDLKVTIDPMLMPCYVDPGQLETALLNLAINARDAMPDGGTMTISAANATVSPGAELDGRAGATAAGLGVAPGRYVIISVADTGQGMSDEVRARAFEPFFTTKGVGKGSGLGLSMVYGFVEQSGGQVRLESAPGLGTIVSLLLKASEAVRPATPAPPAEGAEHGDGRLVLVVEDDDDMRGFAIDALHRLGYRTVSAGNAADALSSLDAHEDVAVLFTDVILPGTMDGFALAQQVRALRPEIPILYTSGYADSQRAPAELLAGEVELLPKPYRVSDLGIRLERLLKREARPVG